MIELIFSVCFLSAPYNCREAKSVYDDITERQCFLGAQFEMARWIGEHPDWRIEKFTCRPAGMFAKL